MIKYVLAALFLGVVAGYVNDSWGNADAGIWISEYAFSFLLFALLFIMGLAYNADRSAIDRMKQAGPRILLVPLTIAVGTILGGLLSAIILGIDLVATTAVSIGCGWYTLSGPMIGQLFGPEWGALGFTSNFLRELLTIMTIPLVSRIDKYAPVASGGATTMDTTLPVITRYCGLDVLVVAFASGFVLSLLAPFGIIAIAALRG